MMQELNEKKKKKTRICIVLTRNDFVEPLDFALLERHGEKKKSLRYWYDSTFE